MTTKARPIGQVKCKTTVYCTICGESHTRKSKAFVYENTPESIEQAKKELTTKANKEYTCRICKTIKNNV